jgi:hypothetical protein
MIFLKFIPGLITLANAIIDIVRDSAAVKSAKKIAAKMYPNDPVALEVAKLLAKDDNFTVEKLSQEMERINGTQRTAKSLMPNH